jgi:hypothetical protein
MITSHAARHVGQNSAYRSTYVTAAPDRTAQKTVTSITDILVINFIEMVERPLPFSLILPVENFLVGLGKERQNLEVNSFHAKNIGDKRPDFAFPLPSHREV